MNISKSNRDNQYMGGGVEGHTSAHTPSEGHDEHPDFVRFRREGFAPFVEEASVYWLKRLAWIVPMGLLLGWLLASLMGCGRDVAAPPPTERWSVASDSMRYEYEWRPDSLNYYRERWVRTTANSLGLALAGDSTARVTGTLAGILAICDLVGTPFTPVGPEQCPGSEFEVSVAFFRDANLAGRYAWRGDTLVVSGTALGWLASGGAANTAWARVASNLVLVATYEVAPDRLGLRWVWKHAL